MGDNYIYLMESMQGNEGKKIEVIINTATGADAVLRRVYFNKHDGLFIWVRGRKYFEYESRLGFIDLIA